MVLVRRWKVAFCLAIALLLTVGTAGPAAAHPASCAVRWGSLVKVVDPRESDTTLTNVRVGRHACYDRLVIDMAGPASGYLVFIQETDDGRTYLSIIAAGVVPRERYGRFEPSVAGFRTFRDVQLGGTGTEAVGSSQINVRLRARLPFRVFTLRGGGGYAESGTQARLVVDVSHRW